jgi:hypothetical protein
MGQASGPWVAAKLGEADCVEVAYDASATMIQEQYYKI